MEMNPPSNFPLVWALNSVITAGFTQIMQLNHEMSEVKDQKVQAVVAASEEKPVVI